VCGGSNRTSFTHRAELTCSGIGKSKAVMEGTGELGRGQDRDQEAVAVTTKMSL
jgi:hypothetical protein